MKVLILDAAGKEFVKRVVKLRRLVRHSTARQVVGNQLMESALEAGSRCAETQSFPISAKRSAAIKADEAVKRTLFLLDVMQAEGYYNEYQAAPVRVLGWEILNTLRIYINNVYYAAPAPVQHVYVSGPAYAQPSAYAYGPSDDDGFYDDYSGEV
jgi:hypothetical protein